MDSPIAQQGLTPASGSMNNAHFDIIIVGAGFAGSLLAISLQWSGWSVVLIDELHNGERVGDR